MLCIFIVMNYGIITDRSTTTLSHRKRLAVVRLLDAALSDALHCGRKDRASTHAQTQHRVGVSVGAARSVLITRGATGSAFVIPSPCARARSFRVCFVDCCRRRDDVARPLLDLQSQGAEACDPPKFNVLFVCTAQFSPAPHLCENIAARTWRADRSTAILRAPCPVRKLPLRLIC